MSSNIHENSSMLTIWDPVTVLGMFSSTISVIERETRCQGLRLNRKRCENPIARPGRHIAADIIQKMSRRAPRTDDPELRTLAQHLLCHQHRGQAAHLTSKWQEKVDVIAAQLVNTMQESTDSSAKLRPGTSARSRADTTNTQLVLWRGGSAEETDSDAGVNPGSQPNNASVEANTTASQVMVLAAASEASTEDANNRARAIQVSRPVQTGVQTRLLIISQQLLPTVLGAATMLAFIGSAISVGLLAKWGKERRREI